MSGRVFSEMGPGTLILDPKSWVLVWVGGEKNETFAERGFGGELSSVD